MTCKSAQTRNQFSHIAGLQVTHWNFDSWWHFYFKALKLIRIVFKWLCNAIKQLKPEICCLRKHFQIFNNRLWQNHLWIEHFSTQISFKVVKWHWCENFQIMPQIFNFTIKGAASNFSGLANILQALNYTATSEHTKWFILKAGSILDWLKKRGTLFCYLQSLRVFTSYYAL